MNKYKSLLLKNDLKVNKITFKGKATIIDTPLGQFVLKENNGNMIYDYLLSRGFNYFPSIVDYDDEGILFRFINIVEYDQNEKAKDLIKLLTLLHSKTTYFIDIDISDNEKIYNSIKNKLLDINYYYNQLILKVDNKEYPSPSEYLFQKNISLFLSSINYSTYMLDKWKDNYFNNNKKRVATLYNNNDIKNVIRDKENVYLLSIDKTIVDNPIFDLLDFYNRYYDKFDFISLLNYYEKYFQLLNNEKDLFYVLISLPNKVDINDINDLKKAIIKLNKSLEILNSEEEKSRNTHKKEDNK